MLVRKLLITLLTLPLFLLLAAPILAVASWAPWVLTMTASNRSTPT